MAHLPGWPGGAGHPIGLLQGLVGFPHSMVAGS